MQSKVGIFIQARGNSERLPGKIYAGLPEPGAPSVLEHIHRRLKSVKEADLVVVLVPEGESMLQEYCRSRGMEVMGGPEHDVRRRYRLAADKYDCDIIVRATGDNPCVDPGVASDTIREIRERKADLLSFSNLPLGVAVEALRREALMSDEIISEPSHREHVSLHIKHNQDVFRVTHLEHPLMEAFGDSPPRLTVDTIEDLRVVRKVYEQLGADFSTEQVLKLFTEQPMLFRENGSVRQRTFAPAV